MRLTKRGQICAGLALGAVTMLGGTQALPNAEENTPTYNSPATQDVVIYEDGSGVQYDGDQEVKTFPEGTFVWNCHTMGNRICGPTHAG